MLAVGGYDREMALCPPVCDAMDTSGSKLKRFVLSFVTGGRI